MVWLRPVPSSNGAFATPLPAPPPVAFSPCRVFPLSRFPLDFFRLSSAPAGDGGPGAAAAAAGGSAGGGGAGGQSNVGGGGGVGGRPGALAIVTGALVVFCPLVEFVRSVQAFGDGGEGSRC